MVRKNRLADCFGDLEVRLEQIEIRLCNLECGFLSGEIPEFSKEEVEKLWKKELKIK